MSSAPDGWLSQVVDVLAGGLDGAPAWRRRVDSEFSRLAGRVPFSVVHDWHAHAVAPLLAAAVARRGGDTTPQHAAGSVHARALAGERVTEAEWITVLEPALRDVYRHAYAYADAYATARANALAYAAANGFSPAGAVEFADGYAAMNTDANARSYADANAIANASALAAAFAAADPRAYAETHPFATVQAYVLAATSEATAEVGTGAVRRRLADGLLESLARAIPRGDDVEFAQ